MSADNTLIDPYRAIVDEALVIRHLGVASGNAREDFDKILAWEYETTLDPRVSEGARKLLHGDRIGQIYHAADAIEVNTAIGRVLCQEPPDLALAGEMLHRANIALEEAMPPEHVIVPRKLIHDFLCMDKACPIQEQYDRFKVAAAALQKIYEDSQ